MSQKSALENSTAKSKTPSAAIDGHGDDRILDKRRQLCIEEAPLGKPLTAANGKDIVKKSTARKGRYLFYIAARFQPTLGGRLGTLAKLDSENPVLYIDFPSGRLKMVGSLVFPKSKYLLLKFGPKEVLCEDAFDSMVMFSSMQWVGLRDSNPSEGPLPMPEELQEAFHRELPLLGERPIVADEGAVEMEQGSQRSTAKRKHDPEVAAEDPSAAGSSFPVTPPQLRGSAQQLQAASSSKRQKAAGSKAKRTALPGSSDPIELSDGDEEDKDAITSAGASAGAASCQRQRHSRRSKTAANERLSQHTRSEGSSSPSSSASESHSSDDCPPPAGRSLPQRAKGVTRRRAATSAGTLPSGTLSSRSNRPGAGRRVSQPQSGNIPKERSGKAMVIDDSEDEDREERCSDGSEAWHTDTSS